MGFGNKLAQYRIEHKLEQKDIAKVLGVTNQTISAYETGTNRPSYNGLIKICNQLKVDANYFMEDDLKYINNGISDNTKTILSAYNKLSDSDRRIVDFILGFKENKIVNLPNNNQNVFYLPVFSQKASAGIGKVEDESKSDLQIICFEDSYVPSGATHGIIIDGHSMEDKFFHNQIVFIQAGLECAPSDYGIFSVTDHEDTRIYCKQLMQRSDGSKYLHSVNCNEDDPDIDYKNVLDIHCIGKILI